MGHSDGGHGSVALLLAGRERSQNRAEPCEDIRHEYLSPQKLLIVTG
jgi:hypothetical protein